MPLKSTLLVLSLLCTSLSAAEPTRSSLAPRKPFVPSPANGLHNPVDLLLQPYFAQHKVPTDNVVSDRVFARRASLDLLGLLPRPDRVAKLEADTHPEKRARYVSELLSHRREYADHWLSFWNDALRNGYKGPGFIDDGRRQITGWLYQSLYENKPYDQFVHELISPVPGSEGFTRGIVWRGTVNASQRREVQAAQNLSQVFLGLNLKCASCHDSFISDWTLSEAYSLASVFSNGPLEIFECDKPTGEKAEVAFLFPELGKIDPKLNQQQRMKRLADLMATKENGRLTRTIVNRLWDRVMGRGLIMPVDEMDNPPWHPDLLDWLAHDLSEHKFDLKHTLLQICSSRAYQMPAVGVPKPSDKPGVFRGPFVKRMTAEQFVDAISRVTGQWQPSQPAMLKRDGRGQGGQLGAIQSIVKPPASTSVTSPALQPKWIWNRKAALTGVPGEQIFLRKSFTLSQRPSAASAILACDNQFVLYVNGQRVAQGNNWSTPVRVNIAAPLKAGTNWIAVEAINFPWPLKPNEKPTLGANPAGFIFAAVGEDDTDANWTLMSDQSWLAQTKDAPGWQTGDDQQKWTHAAELTDLNGAPWKLGKLTPSPTPSLIEIRASLAMNDPLMRALGRPTRDQVVTRRDPWATTLQALELTNGSTLDKLLSNGANLYIQHNPTDSQALVKSLYLTALSREPTSKEQAIAVELIGLPATKEGVADLLWITLMLPEFQLIY